MSRRISRTGLLIALAFMVPFIVELRTVAGFVGVDLSIAEYLGLAAALVVGVVVAVAVWNATVAANEPPGECSEGV